MSSFPVLHAENTLQQQTVSAPSNASPASFQVLQGFDPDFRPAGLPPPTWFITVNPNGFDDPERVEVNLNECFEPHSQDAELMRMSGVSIEDARSAMWHIARGDATDYVDCDNGGLYAIWELPGGDLVLGGFDNGGSCIASSLEDISDHLDGKVVLVGGMSHFTPESLLSTDAARLSNTGQKEAAIITKWLFESVAPSATPQWKTKI